MAISSHRAECFRMVGLYGMKRSKAALSHKLRERDGTMKLSTRNVIKGKIVDVKQGPISAKIRIDIGGGNVLTSTITADAAEDLALKAGDEVCALIKASNVMIMKE